jgi:hypothetical protein
MAPETKSRLKATRDVKTKVLGTLTKPTVAEGVEGKAQKVMPRERGSGLSSLSTEHSVFTLDQIRRTTSLNEHRRAVYADRARRHPGA